MDENDRALLDVKVQRDQLNGHLRRLRGELVRDEDAARSFIRSGKKQQAMLALRKKKHDQQLVGECEQHHSRLNELIDQIELARMQRDTVEALAVGVATLKRVQREIGGTNRIQQILEEQGEAIEAQQELSAALSGAGIATDDAEALAELARLEAACAAEAPKATAVAPGASGHGSAGLAVPRQPAVRPTVLPALAIGAG